MKGILNKNFWTKTVFFWLWNKCGVSNIMPAIVKHIRMWGEDDNALGKICNWNEAYCQVLWQITLPYLDISLCVHFSHGDKCFAKCVTSFLSHIIYDSSMQIKYSSCARNLFWVIVEILVLGSHWFTKLNITNCRYSVLYIC